MQMSLHRYSNTYWFLCPLMPDGRVALITKGLYMAVVFSIKITWISGWNRRAVNESLLSVLLLYCHRLITLIRFKEGVKNDGVTPIMSRTQGGNEWVLCEHAWAVHIMFNGADAEWCGSELAKIPQFLVPTETGTPASCKKNACGYTCTWPCLIFLEESPCDKVAGETQEQHS